jgi:Ca2+-binding RTX toxin-like protein
LFLVSTTPEVQPAAGYLFTYGTETSLNTGFTLFPNFQPNGTVSVGSGQFTTNGTLANYYTTQAISGPSIGEVATGGPLSFSGAFTVPNDVLMMMPGDPNAQIAVTRFTAPEKGLFDITGSFTDLESATVSVAVLVNGITQFSGSFSGQHGTIPFSISNLNLDAGATIDFVVDSLGERSNDVLGLKALITENPANTAPTLALTNTTTSLLENTNTSSALKVADITITDDGVGTNALSLSGADKDMFFISSDGKGLFLKAGTVLDYESGNTTLDVTVAVDDSTVGSTPDASKALSITVTNVVGKTIVGGNGGQTLTGTIEEDTINGGNGKDVLNGGGGNDFLSGGKGADVLNGGGGNDTMDGGDGNDVFIFAPGFGNDRVLGFDANPKSGQDFLDISAFGITSATFAARVTITDVGADTLVTIDGNVAQTILLVGLADSTTVTQADFLF